MNQMIMPIVSKVAIIGFFTLMLCGCGGRQEREQSAKPQSITQTEMITGKESREMQEQKVDGVQQSTGGSVQNPVRGEVYYEYEPVFSPEEIRKQMVGRWRFHIDSVKVYPFIGHQEDLRHAIHGSFEVVFDNIGEGDSCTVSVPFLFLGKSVYVLLVSPAYEDGDENEDGYAGAYFADFQIVVRSKEIKELTGDDFLTSEGRFLSAQKWQGVVSFQRLRYYGTAHRVK